MHLVLPFKKRAMLSSIGGGKIQKLNSASSNYSDCNFSAKSNNFYKITVIRGFNNFGGLNAPYVVTKTFWGQNNTKNEFRTIKLLRLQFFKQIKKIKKITIRAGFNF